MRGQITLDAVFSLLIAISGVLFMSILAAPDNEYKALDIERKSTDAVLVVTKQELSGFADGNASARIRLESLLVELKETIGLSGLRLSTGDNIIFVGERSELSSKKHFIVRSEDRVLVGEIIVWG